MKRTAEVVKVVMPAVMVFAMSPLQQQETEEPVQRGDAPAQGAMFPLTMVLCQRILWAVQVVQLWKFLQVLAKSHPLSVRERQIVRHPQ